MFSGSIDEPNKDGLSAIVENPVHGVTFGLKESLLEHQMTVNSLEQEESQLDDPPAAGKSKIMTNDMYVYGMAGQAHCFCKWCGLYASKCYCA
ncbi:MAG: hypothetical protein GY679_04620 [Mycoplasma sp.]|nr:hypothetical protein [Mycoplasma sp.]